MSRSSLEVNASLIGVAVSAAMLVVIAGVYSIVKRQEGCHEKVVVLGGDRTAAECDHADQRVVVEWPIARCLCPRDGGAP